MRYYILRRSIGGRKMKIKVHLYCQGVSIAGVTMDVSEGTDFETIKEKAWPAFKDVCSLKVEVLTQEIKKG